MLGTTLLHCPCLLQESNLRFKSKSLESYHLTKEAGVGFSVTVVTIGSD